VVERCVALGGVCACRVLRNCAAVVHLPAPFLLNIVLGFFNDTGAAVFCFLPLLFLCHDAALFCSSTFVACFMPCKRAIVLLCTAVLFLPCRKCRLCEQRFARVVLRCALTSPGFDLSAAVVTPLRVAADASLDGALDNTCAFSIAAVFRQR
jgi:hypothetical protein